MWLAFRERLPQAVVDEMDHYSAVLRGYLYNQHNDAGAHTDVTADSVEATGVVSSDTELRGPLLTGTGTGGVVLPVQGPAASDLVNLGVQRNPFAGSRLLNSSPLDVQLLQRLNLGNRVDVALSGRTIGFTGTAGREAGFGVDEICYAITSTDGTDQLRQIYMPLGASNQPGSLLPRDLQTIVVWNATSSTILVGGAASEAFTDGIHGGPVTLGAGGAMLLVYDGSIVKGGQDGGWRIIGVNGLGWASYTPSFTNAAGDATVGDGSVNGFYCVDGHVCHVHARAVMGSGFSWGSGGSVGISLPFDVASFISANRYIFDAMFFDSSTPYAGQGQFLVLGGQDCVGLRYVNLSNGQLSPVTGSTPFSWSSGDRVDVVGTYPI